MGRRYDPELAAVLAAEPELALRALAIEREGVANPRKDLRKWADFRGVYGYFFPQLFELVTDPADARFGGLDPDLVRAVADAFAAGYQPPAGRRTPTGSTRSAGSRPTSGSRPARRSTSRTRPPTPAPSPRRPRSSGC